MTQSSSCTFIGPPKYSYFYESRCPIINRARKRVECTSSLPSFHIAVSVY